MEIMVEEEAEQEPDRDEIKKTIVQKPKKMRESHKTKLPMSLFESTVKHTLP